MLVFVLLLILLSFESSLFLPLFSIYFFWQRIKNFSVWQALLALFLASIFLSSFYYLSLAITSSLVFLFYFLAKANHNPMFSIFYFMILNLYIFFVGKQDFNLFYLIHVAAFIFLIYKKEFKHYAGKNNQK